MGEAILFPESSQLKEFELPENARKFIERYDDEQEVKPFEFEITDVR